MAKQKKKVLLCDADLLAFRCAAAAESRTVEVIHKPSGRSKIFTNRTAFKDSLKLRPNFIFLPGDYEYVDIQSEEDVSHPMRSIKVGIEAMIKDVGADAVRLYIGGENNFRVDLPLPTKYKVSREGGIRPVHLDACKQYVINKHNGILVHGHEADDEQIIDGYYFLNKGWEVYLATSDKDSFAYSGMYSYDFTQDKPEPHLIEDFGELYVRPNGDVKGWGFKWFCHQWLFGDPTDDYKPCELWTAETGKKFGEKSSYKLLKDCTTKQECFDVVAEQYESWYPKPVVFTDWKGEVHEYSYWEMMQLYFKCARMKSTKDDKLVLEDFLDREGVKYG